MSFLMTYREVCELQAWSKDIVGSYVSQGPLAVHTHPMSLRHVKGFSLV